jgi:hypothetical protein
MPAILALLWFTLSAVVLFHLQVQRTIFYISYTVFEFQALMWKIVKPHQWAAFVVFSWYECLASRHQTPYHRSLVHDS